MTITQLKYFLSICEFGKIRIASERLHVSEPTISVSIKRLEEELDEPLFIRSRGQLILTDKGRLLQEKAAEVVESFDNLKAELLRQPQNFSVIRLGAPSTLSEYVCVSLISEFAEKYPSVLFETPTFSPLETAQQVEDEKIELAICDQLAVTSKQLVFSPIIHAPLSGYVRDDHPLAGQQNVVPQMMKDEKMILLRERGMISEEIKRWFHNGGVNPNIFLYSNREILSVTFAMIKRRNGVAFLLDDLYTRNEHMQPFPPEGIASFSLAPPLTFAIGIVRKKGVRLSKDAQRFFDFCSHYHPK